MVVQADDMFVGSTYPNEYMGSWLTDTLGKLKGTGVSVGVGDTSVSLNNTGGLSVQKGSKTPPAAGASGMIDIVKKNWMYIAGAGVVLWFLTKKKAVV